MRMDSESARDQLTQETLESIQMLLDAVAGLTDEQVLRRPGGTLPSIAFHLWHTARWLDYDCEVYGGARQAWLGQGFADRWQLKGLEQSDGGTGTGLGDEEAAGLELPGRNELIAYANAAVRVFAQTLETMPEARKVLLMHVTHVNRHLGMVEAIKGLQGMRGTATR
jgi:hypothetical protein